MIQDENDPYEIVEVPGWGGFPMLAIRSAPDVRNMGETGSRSPWWMINIKIDGKDILESTIQGSPPQAKALKNYGTLLGFDIASGVKATHDICEATGQSWMIWHEYVTVIILDGGHATDIENAVGNGKLVTEISLVQLAWVTSWKNLQIFTFEDAFFVSLHHDLGRLFVTFRVTKKEYKYFAIDQAGKAISGQAVCTVDFSKTIVDAKM